MNRIYRLVWNRALRVLQVASELVPHSRGGADSACGWKGMPQTALALALAAAITSLPSLAHAQSTASGGGGTGSSASAQSSMVGGSGGSAGVNGATAGSGYQAGGAASTPGANGGNANNVDVENAGAGGGGGGANGGTSLGTSTLTGGNGGNGAYNNWGGAGGGGAGGFGAVLVGASGSLANQAAITGGTGGTGGWGGWGGGGGGGGGSGLYASTSTPGTSLTLNAAVTGGAGGAGGNSGGGGYNVAAGAGGNSSGAGGASVTGNGGSAGGSGGGGGAGVSFVSSASGATTVTSNTFVTGGNGGNAGEDGGSNGTGGGNGGSGGAGMNLSGTQITLINSGSIIGGNGGQGGACNTFCTGVAGSSGSGGVGLIVSGGNNTIINNGSISGGLSGDGSTRADAIDLSGGGNTLVLQANSNITGNVVSNSGSTNGGDTLALGGDTNASGGNSFNAAQIGGVGSGVQYQGFTNYSKTGASTWTLTGSTTALTPWVITGGTLVISSDAGLGSDSGSVTLNGGTLEDTASFEFAHPLVIGSAGGTLQIDAGNTLFAIAGITGTGNLTQTGSGSLLLSGVVNTVGNQTYNGTLEPASALTLSASTITLNAVNGLGGALTLISATTSLNGNMSNLLQFTDYGLTQTTNPISIATTGDGQTYGPLQLGGNTTLSDSLAGNIELTGGANGSSYDLNVQTGGQITFDSLVGVAGLTTQSGTFSATALVIGNDGLSVQTTAGAIGQNGAFSVQGSSTFNAGSNNITLTNTQNAFTGAVSLTGNNAALTNSVATVLGASQIAGALTLTSESTLSQNGGISAASLGGSSAGDTTLTNQSNAIATLGNFNASGNFSLTDATALTVSGTLSASNVTLADTHTATVTGTITAASITNAQGTLQVGNGGTTGSLGGNVVNQGSLLFDRSDVVTFGNTISGAGSLTQNGSGTLILDGINTYTGTTIVQAGTLEIGDASHASASISSNVSVASGASLSGHGTIVGNVALASGSQLAPGGSIGTLTVNGNLTAAQGTLLNFQFGVPGANFQTAGSGDSVNVTGNLELDGATLNVTDAGGFGDGLYSLFTYGGSLIESNGGISLGTTPTGSTLAIQNLTASEQINLLNTTGMTLDFWNGNGLASATQSGGGNGTWTTASSNWTNAIGSVTAAIQPQPGFAIFSGAAGIVTVDDSAGSVSATGLQFASNGYTLTGGTLTLVGNSGAAPVIRVGNGTASGAAYSATIANVIAGSAGLVKSDFGTLVLTGANTYTGGTTISAGTLQIGNGGTSGSVLGNIANNGTLAFDRSDSVTFAGNISGTGLLTQSGIGTLTLTGTNTYTGGTTIQAGTLEGNTTSLQGNIVDNATLAFNQTSTGTFSGVISGTGSLVQSGAGTLILTGANVYSGGTTVNAGTLQGDSSSLQGAIADNATLVFNQSADGSFSGDISGNGALLKTGIGTLVLDGVNAFTGNTTVQAGTLEVGDSNTPSALLGGNVQVTSSATLRGHGTIGGSVINDGTLWPGGSIGALTIQGNYTQNADGTLAIDVAPNGQSDQLIVNGKAVLGGTLNLLEQSGTWQPRTNYTILTASGGLSGQFASISSNMAFLTPVLNYGANSLDLSLERNDINFVTAALTPNERAVATVANTLGFNNAVYSALVTLSAPAAAQAFNQLSGEIYASDRTAVVDDDRYVRDAINNHLLGLDNSANGQSAQSEDGVTAWTSGWGQWGNHDGNGNASALQANGSGLLIGADMSIASNSHLGAVIGSGQSSVRIDTLNSSSHVIDQHLGFYGNTQLSAFQLQAAAVYGWQRVDTNRSIDFGSLSDTASSSYHAHTTQAYVDGSYALSLGQATLSPFINLAYEQLHTPQIQEGGSAADLNVAGQNSTQTYGTLGLRGTYALDANGDFYLHASAGWQHAWGDTDANITARFTSGGDSFDIAGVPVATNAGAIDAGFSFRPSSNLTIDATYSGQFASHARDQAARLSATLTF